MNISGELFKRTRSLRIPLILNYEVTSSCNLNCVHCYHRGVPGQPERELDKDEIRELFCQIKNMGTIFILFTGGEPFVRKDFMEIAQMARQMGFALIIFTNGTMLGEYEAAWLKELSPFSVHVSLYSIVPGIHDLVTSVEGSFEKTAGAIETLRKYGIDPVIKTPVMSRNLDYADSIGQWAADRGLMHKVDPVVSSCFEQNRCQIDPIRLTEEQIQDLVFNRGLYDPRDFRPRESFECYAGKNMASMDAFGNIFPCIAWRRNSGNIREKSIADIWNSMDTDYSFMEPCRDCPELGYCGVCPGMAEQEGVDMFCRLAEKTRQVVSGVEYINDN